jgi:2'-5' RNA ligase
MFLLCSFMGPAFSAVSSNVHLFFAVVPPRDMRPVIERLGLHLQQAHHLRGQRIGRDRLHVTLAPVHDSHASFVDVLARAQSIGAALRHPPFPLGFEWSESFQLRRQSHPLVLRGDAGVRRLMEFRQTLRAAIVRAGFAVPSSYTPHLTLLWADRCVQAHPIAPLCWPVCDFALVASVAGQTRHTHVGRWPLR